MLLKNIEKRDYHFWVRAFLGGDQQEYFLFSETILIVLIEEAKTPARRLDGSKAGGRKHFWNVLATVQS